MKIMKSRLFSGMLVVLALVIGSISMLPLGSGPLAAAQATPGTNDVEVTLDLKGGGGGAKNIVKVNNRQDDHLHVRGRVQLNQITGPTVEPINYAEAYASCTDCETVAVALQINLIDRDARRVTPQNAAVAVNVGCVRCRTIAIALQYVYSVDDPRNVPKEVEDLVREMDRELREIGKDRDASLSDVVARINDVISRFETLAESLNDERDETSAQTSPTPTPAASPPGEATGSEPSSGTTEATATPGVAEATEPLAEDPATSTVAPSPTSPRRRQHHHQRRPNRHRQPPTATVAA